MLFKKKTKEDDSGHLSPLASSLKKLEGIIRIPTNHEPKQLYKEIIFGSILIYLILEILSNRSLVDGLIAPLKNPLMFICNTGLIALTMSLGLLLPKRHIGYLLSTVFWLWLGTVNFILLGSRTTPLTAMDFKMLTSVFTVINRYLTMFQMVLFVIAMILLLIGVVTVCIKLPRTKWMPVKGVFGLALCYAAMMLSFQMAIATGQVSRNFGNIAHAYLDYGFAYSFSTSVVDRGIQRPSTYSMKSIDDLLESMKTRKRSFTEPLNVYGQERFWLSESNGKTIYELVAKDEDLVTTGSQTIFTETTVVSEDPVEEDLDLQTTTEEPSDESDPGEAIITQTRPNIIMVQLETFFDVKRLKDYTYNQDPLPNYTRLSEEFSSGLVTVPSIGAGTANTEFEILTGMSLDYFGAGEYPYKTILAKQTVESYAFDLSEIGYHTHGIHNNMGTFYARHSVYPRLGFDGFTSIEYMEDVPYNPTGWAKDEVLIPEIIKVLEHTDTADFVYAVSVQAHGKYPDYPLLEDPEIELTPARWAGEDSESEAAHTLSAEDYQYLYYINQLYEVDQFVGDLVEELEDFPEPVLVVFYGDHLPTFEFTEDTLTAGTPFQTEYLIWDNMDLEEIDRDLMAYQLGSHVMGLVGYETGIINQYHQTRLGSDAYEEDLELLQYDLLYGEKAAYGGTNPYKKKKVARGVDKAEITEVVHKGEALFIHGGNFTMWSEVFVDGVQMDTIFIDSETLLINMDELASDASFKVSQMTKTGRKLSSTKKYVQVSEEEEENVLDLKIDQLRNEIILFQEN